MVFCLDRVWANEGKTRVDDIPARHFAAAKRDAANCTEAGDEEYRGRRSKGICQITHGWAGENAKYNTKWFKIRYDIYIAVFWCDCIHLLCGNIWKSQLLISATVLKKLKMLDFFSLI